MNLYQFVLKYCHMNQNIFSTLLYMLAVLCMHSEQVKLHKVDIKNEFNCLLSYCTIDYTIPSWKVENESELCWFSGTNIKTSVKNISKNVK